MGRSDSGGGKAFMLSNIARLLLCAVTLIVAIPAQASLVYRPRSERALPNIRPFFDAGYSTPFRFGRFTRGNGIGLGFEAEQSRHLSVLFRLEWHELSGEQTTTYYVPYVTTYTDRFSHAAMSWSLGMRFHPFGQGVLHPYTETSVGVRMMNNDGRAVVFQDGESHPLASSESSGVTATVRLGISTARRGGAGLFADGGIEFIAHNPGDYGIAPLRIGVMFP